MSAHRQRERRRCIRQVQCTDRSVHTYVSFLSLVVSFSYIRRFSAEIFKQAKSSRFCSGAFKAFLLPVAYLFKASHFWLATVQLVLQADWHEVWHLPQPPLAAVSLRLALLTVLMCFIKTPPFMLSF